ALVGEAIADVQLARFRKTPQAKTEFCEAGLWRYSRHPNYFFEWLCRARNFSPRERSMCSSSGGMQET
ncbi:DUF1295 domain-containing protein, partial [Rhizobium johnstonii]|uniref:DUF1295 domain-containing protein n=1 Tax=Rhizobium johnstonii TaxID=3019933 RepID=UPI003F97192E